MCGRFSLFFFPDAEREFYERFGIPFPTLDYPASYNIAPGGFIPVVRSVGSGANEVVRMFWGLISPASSQFKPHPKFSMTNTRVESFDKEKLDFRSDLLETCRCVIPANNYFEWQQSGKAKIPYKIEMQDAALMSLGGLYSIWQDSNGKQLMSCSIITVPANRQLQAIHPRMPFVLRGEAQKVWLERSAGNFRSLRNMITPYPEDLLRCVHVSRKVNSTRNDGPELVEPLEDLETGSQFDLFQ